LHLRQFFHQYRLIIIIQLIWTLSILILFNYGFDHIKSGPSSAPTLIESLSNWDGRHYLRLSQTGYQDTSDYAFFPLYPLFIKFMSPLSSPLIASLIISWISLTISLILLHHLIKKNFNSPLAYQTIFTLLVFPTSFYLLTAHSESLFLALTLGVFNTLTPRPKLITFIFLALAILTRPFGFALFLLVFGYGFYHHWKWHQLILSGLGLIIFSVWLFIQQQNITVLLTSQNTWLRHLTTPWQPLTDQIKNITTGQAFLYPINLINLFCATLQLGLAFRSWRFLPKTLAIYSIILAIFPLFTGSLSSIPRFMIINFPIFITLSLIKNKLLYWSYLAISLIGLIAYPKN
jgi:hypothetical protein